jgi:hypothetical protein
LNPFEEPEDVVIDTPGDGGDIILEECEDPENTYRPAGEELCI